MRVLVCIDDTDNLESRGTGELASLIAKAIEEKEWGKSHRVTRHQLLVHPDIPYTSHNSCMCFIADIEEAYLDQLINYASDFLEHECAVGSDPGLCILAVEHLADPDRLIEFGYRAKDEVLTKDDAYKMARELGIHLSEHGGTGQGVIGALAGTGLRLSGNDGRLRGKLKIKADGDVITVGAIRAQAQVDAIRSLNEGIVLGDDERVLLGETLKAVLIDGQTVMLVFPTEKPITEVQWQTCTKNQLKPF